MLTVSVTVAEPIEPRSGDAVVSVPQLSPSLVAVIRSLLSNIDRLVERIVAAISTGVDDYANLKNESIGQDVIRAVRFHARVWLETLLNGTTLSPDILDQVAVMGRRRAHQDISLPALQRAFHIGSREAWSTLLDAARPDGRVWEELLYKVSPYFLYHFDFLAQNIGAAYQAEQHLRTRWRDRLRYELGGIIFSQPENMRGFYERAQALGLDVSANHSAMTLRLTEPANQSAEFDEKMDPFFDAVGRLLGTRRDSLLYMTNHGDVLVWSALTRGETFLANETRLVSRAKALMDEQSKIATIGIGLPARAHLGWRRSAEQSLKALDVGMRLNPRDRIHRYSDFVLDSAVLASEDSVWFLDALIRELSAEADLLETLSVYLEVDMHRKVAAGRLSIHANTLDYRLNRIEEILRAPLTNVGVLAQLNAALRLRRISQASPP
jgi:carbohydrate diacid regulator